MSVAPSASTPSTAALRAGAIRSLIHQGVHRQHPSLSENSIIKIAPKMLFIRFPGSEFFMENGKISPLVIEDLAHQVARASMEMEFEEPSQTGRQCYKSQRLHQLPKHPDVVEIVGRTTHEGVNLFQLQYVVTARRGKNELRVAVGKSAFHLEPFPDAEQSFPVPKHRGSKKTSDRASAKDPIVLPPTALVVPDAPPQQQQSSDGRVVTDGPSTSSQPPQPITAPPSAPAPVAAAPRARALWPVRIVPLPPRPRPSTLLYPYSGNMDFAIEQEFMLTNVRCLDDPEEAKELFEFLMPLGVTPSNIQHSPMFIHSRHVPTYVYYFDIEDNGQKAILGGRVIPEHLWIKKFHVTRCVNGEQFVAHALSMKMYFVTVVIGTWIHLNGLRAPRLLDRTRAVSSMENLSSALQWDRHQHNIGKHLNPDGKMMLVLLRRQI